MKLKGGYSYDAFRSNISLLVNAGHERNAACAIAADRARSEFFKRFPAGALPQWLNHQGYRLKKEFFDSGRPIQRNPSRKEKTARGTVSVVENAIKRARKLGFDFSGHDPKILKVLKVSTKPQVLLCVGTVLGIIYRAKRDEVETDYIHKFRFKKARPTLAVTHDGRQMKLLGGAFQFTDRGIEDDPY